MKPTLPPYIAFALALPALAACTNDGPRSYQGYAEGEYVRVAAPFAGTLEVLEVKRGARVNAGDSLFTLEQENEAAARREARERLKNAEAHLADLRKGKRPSEIEAVQAQLGQAEAAAQYSRSQLQRAEDLVAQNFVARDRLDEARATHDRDIQRVAELKAQLATARL